MTLERDLLALEVMNREAAIAAIGAGQRWTGVRFDDGRVVTLTGQTALVDYRAVARREADAGSVHAFGPARKKVLVIRAIRGCLERTIAA